MRYKEFNSNRVLEKCITLFWNKGFGACSINDIVQTTGVNRFSLYNEFNNKEGILYAALELYRNRYLNEKLSPNLNKKSLQEELVAIFTKFLKDEDSHPPGCFTIQIATELADRNERIKEFLDNYINKLEANFLQTLEKFKPGNPQNQFYSIHLTGLFCSSMCYCVIQTYEERISQISTGINVILNKKTEYATHA
ncbi:MAG: TetR/AcrR family transcriptional regulator [Bacteroidetes bacterium]|nr:TetR/AcrR family transcriptional regulator [Bacteroidota bacterium]